MRQLEGNGRFFLPIDMKNVINIIMNETFTRLFNHYFIVPSLTCSMIAFNKGLVQNISSIKGVLKMVVDPL